jgi:hypothetical protein
MKTLVLIFLVGCGGADMASPQVAPNDVVGADMAQAVNVEPTKKVGEDMAPVAPSPDMAPVVTPDMAPAHTLPNVGHGGNCLADYQCADSAGEAGSCAYIANPDGAGSAHTQCCFPAAHAINNNGSAVCCPGTSVGCDHMGHCACN